MTKVANNEPFEPKKDPLERPDYSPYVLTAMRAVASGTADARQQKSAMDYIIKVVCGNYDMPFRHGPNDRQTNVALGKMHVGQTIVWLLNSAEAGDLDKTSARQPGESENVSE